MRLIRERSYQRECPRGTEPRTGASTSARPRTLRYTSTVYSGGTATAGALPQYSFCLPLTLLRLLHCCVSCIEKIIWMDITYITYTSNISTYIYKSRHTYIQIIYINGMSLDLTTRTPSLSLPTCLLLTHVYYWHISFEIRTEFSFRRHPCIFAMKNVHTRI